MAVSAESPAKIRRIDEGPANVILQFESESGIVTGMCISSRAHDFFLADM